MASLRTSAGGIELELPGMVASGIMDETGPTMARMLELGAGAVVSKSVGTEPKPGHANPCFTEVTGGYVNAMGLPNPGIELFAEEMAKAVGKGPIVGSIYGAGPDEFARLAGRMEDYGASAVELNLSCPHAKGYGMEVGTDPRMVRDIVSAVKSAVKVPVWAKLTPNTHILPDIGRAVQDAGGDAVVAINTLKAMVIEPEFARPLLSNRFGGLSGPCVKPVGVRAVYDLRTVLDIPIIGVGGIASWRDAAEYIMAGASAFQVGSAIGTVGIDVFQRINSGLSAFMDEYGYRDIASMVGVAHERCCQDKERDRGGLRHQDLQVRLGRRGEARPVRDGLDPRRGRDPHVAVQHRPQGEIHHRQEHWARHRRPPQGEARGRAPHKGPVRERLRPLIQEHPDHRRRRGHCGRHASGRRHRRGYNHRRPLGQGHHPRRHRRRECRERLDCHRRRLPRIPRQCRAAHEGEGRLEAV
ncbi:MAG: dihydroorotate dehydrogenase [Candidatus Methanomethylophilaceae archaeon]|nr:dihydroorotate dehydrogenase [Candidatus Methanomethylophilaceae archaeon]